MGQRTNLLLQVEGRSGARLNRVYHLQWGYRKYLPMAFLHILSSRYFKPEKPDIFEFYTHSLKTLDGITLLERDWSKLDFNKLEDCQEVLNHRNNNNWQLFGHVHTRKNNTGLDAERLQHLYPTQYDVGVDNNHFAPVSFEQVQKIISKQIEHQKQTGQ